MIEAFKQKHPAHLVSLSKIMMEFCEMNEKHPYFIRIAFEKLLDLFMHDFAYMLDFKDSFVYIATCREL